MDGVIILNSYETLSNASTIFLFIIWGSVFAAIAVGFFYIFLKDKYSIFTVILAIVAGALAVIFFCNIPKAKYETYYQVTIDNSVTMNEFQSKYKIIKVEGEIYTVTECVK